MGIQWPWRYGGVSALRPRAVEQKVKVDVSCWPSNLESNMGNETGAPLGIEPGLRKPVNHCVRGHSCGTSTQARGHSEALPALGTEKRVRGVLLKRRQIRLPRTTRAVAHKPLRQGKKSSAKARGHTGKENTVCQPEVLTFTSPQEESSQGPPLFCWPPPLSPAPYMTMTLGQHLIVSPSLDLHEAFALSSPCYPPIPLFNPLTSCFQMLGYDPLPHSSMEHHPPEPQGPIASDQALGSATLECQETLEAAEALMTLKNSSWTWRRTHR
ncbi:Dmrtc1c2 [Phodopus roborovskii]|uniref:Dmrtc1c2 protein n=1 Tax=Phodopus roborovskii TaxID=109678 RepID=A0AAU9YYB8_PHORO|nr:Dmrtc1c2 [Phodopus roborovskii]